MAPSAENGVPLPNGNQPSVMPSSINGPEPLLAEYPSTEPKNGPYEILDQYHSKRSRIRVASVGCGASGLCLAYKMNKMLEPGSFDLVLYDKNAELGGTWLENQYPGVACDIPAHLYTFSFDPNPGWTQYFACGAEIQEYFNGFADKHNLRQYMKVNTKVIEARFEAREGLWNIVLEDTRTGTRTTDWAHVLINGTGVLNSWKWPDISGLHDFQGPLVHSARWDHDVEFSGKTVGIIGTGTSSVQIVPILQKSCDKLSIFMRSPTWVSPPFGGGVMEKYLTKGAPVSASSRQYNFSESERQRFREDPAFHLQFRKEIEAEINGLFGLYKHGSEMSHHFKGLIEKEMHRRMGEGHEELKKFIVPTWPPGCRRLSPGDGYLEALVQPNVRPVYSNITKISPEGLITADGELHKCDIIVAATGFDVSWKPSYQVINADGISLAEDWGDLPNMYMGVSAPRFPNYFTLVGPGATWSNGTLLPPIETTVEYAIKMMIKMQAEQILAIEVRQDATDELQAHANTFHKDTVWMQNCKAWFKENKKGGRIHVWPGSTIHFLKTIKEPRLEDYRFTYRNSNRFAYLGDGSVKATQTRDVQGLSPYIRNEDIDWSVE